MWSPFVRGRQTRTTPRPQLIRPQKRSVLATKRLKSHSSVAASPPRTIGKPRVTLRKLRPPNPETDRRHERLGSISEKRMQTRDIVVGPRLCRAQYRRLAKHACAIAFT